MFIFLIVGIIDINAQNEIILRPYLKVGALLTPPSLEDLDYEAGVFDDIQDVSKVTYGSGIQVLRESRNGIYWGGELGLQNLFTSKLHFPLDEYQYTDFQSDKEWEVFFGPLVEYSKKESPFFLQAGVGMHVVFWEFIYDYADVYTDRYVSDGGTEINVGFSLTGGMKLKLTDRVEFPIAIRADIMPRYGVLLQAGCFISLDYIIRK